MNWNIFIRSGSWRRKIEYRKRAADATCSRDRLDRTTCSICGKLYGIGVCCDSIRVWLSWWHMVQAGQSDAIIFSLDFYQHATCRSSRIYGGSKQHTRDWICFKVMIGTLIMAVPIPCLPKFVTLPNCNDAHECSNESKDKCDDRLWRAGAQERGWGRGHGEMDGLLPQWENTWNLKSMLGTTRDLYVEMWWKTRWAQF